MIRVVSFIVLIPNKLELSFIVLIPNKLEFGMLVQLI